MSPFYVSSFSFSVFSLFFVVIIFFMFMVVVFFFYLNKITFIAYFISQLGTCFDRAACFLPPGDSQSVWGESLQGFHRDFHGSDSEEAPIGKTSPGEQIALWFLI